MKWMVLTKEPKVHSTAIRQMREEIKKIQLIFVHIKKMNKMESVNNERTNC